MLGSGKERVSGVERWPRGTRGSCFILPRRSRCGEDTYKVNEKPSPNNWVLLTASNISSLVIDYLDEQVCDLNIAVAALYCDYLDQEKQSMTNLLGAILTQLFTSDGIREPVQQPFRRVKHSGRAAKLSDLMEMLKATIALLQQVFICIDALDECPPEIRLKLLQSLQEIARASPTTRVFLTGRPHVRDEVKRYFPEAIMIPITPTLGDIETFLKMRLEADPTPVAMDQKLRAEIMSVIPRMNSQM